MKKFRHFLIYDYKDNEMQLEKSIFKRAQTHNSSLAYDTD